MFRTLTKIPEHLEIHDGNSGSSERFFQFRTDDGTGNAIFKVKTDDYLFGISGSGGSFLSEYIGKILEETKKRPQYIIKKILNNHKKI